MRYPKEHKARTRQKIVETAARQFREKGIGGVGVAELMAAAGLTHGGFYAHFASKEQLVEETCRSGIAATTELLGFRADAAPPGEGLRTILRSYLSRSHRDDPVRGCVIPCLAAEVARHGADTRQAFTDQLRQLTDLLAQHLPDRPGQPAGERALALAASLVGAILLARAVDDGALSDAILAATRAAMLDSAPAEAVPAR